MSTLTDTSDSEDEADNQQSGGEASMRAIAQQLEARMEDHGRKSFSSDTEPETMIETRSFQMTNNMHQFSLGQKRSHKDDDDNEDSVAPHAKKSRVQDTKVKTSTVDIKAQRMMAKMGYQEGTGLGKKGQGRIEPVEMSSQRGRRGLGLHIPGLDAAGQKWDPSLEEIKVQEDMIWLENNHSSVPTMEELQDWLKFGPKQLVIENEYSFCREEVLKGVLSSKSVFDRLDGNELRRARTRSNPYETIRGAFFLNRAAVKMANIDRACDFAFTKPKNLAPNELLYFADVCAGPGGFSEYVLWKKKWNAKGFGFTLKGENDFKLEEFYAGPCETFHPYYGPKDNGDVYDPENQKGFFNLVMEETEDKGLHFMMADGGFSVEGQENIQEILSKQLYLCQCLVALMVLREGGNFVVKLFDLFTHFSAGLVYLMYRCFDRICIFKPNSSRPANSERYLICLGKRPDVSSVIEHLSQVNEYLLHPRKNTVENDVIQLVSPSELETEKELKSYLTDSNDILGQKQIVGLVKIAAFCNDSTLTEPTQADMRTECLAHWGLPIKSRVAPRIDNARARLQSLIKSSTLDFLTTPSTELSIENNKPKLIGNSSDWFCMPSASGKDPAKSLAMFYFSLGRSNVFRLEQGNWVRENEIELSPDTLVYAEMVSELRKEHRSQLRTSALHILDAYLLGGEDVSQLHLKERSEKIKKFCTALKKPRGHFTPVRAKNLYPLKKGLEDGLYPCLKSRIMKNGTTVTAYVPLLGSSLLTNSRDEPYFFVMNSILLLKGTAHPWSCHLSRSTNVNYYYNSKTRENLYEKDKPAEANATFRESFDKRLVWYWSSSKLLTKDEVLAVVNAHCSLPP